MAINPSDILLTGQVAVVTGGGTGIGRGISRTILIDVEHGRRGLLFERLYDIAEVLECPPRPYSISDFASDASSKVPNCMREALPFKPLASGAVNRHQPGS